jgi:hypothetical protein
MVMRRIFQEGHLYTKNGSVPIRMRDSKRNYYTRLAMVTALLHDLGHGPLSHALDMHIGLAAGKTLKPDRDYSIAYVNKYLRPAIKRAGVSPDHVVALIGEYRQGLPPWMSFVGDLIDSPLDVDRMDYLARDAHMTGLSAGALNMQGLMERAVPYEETEEEGGKRIRKIELAFDKSAVPYIEQFVYARDVMYFNCYEHPKKVAAEKMLGRAFEDFRKRPDGEAALNVEDLAILSDQEMLQLILESSGPGTLAFRMVEALMKGNVFEKVQEVPIPLRRPPKGKRLSQLTPDERKQVFGGLTAVLQHWIDQMAIENYQAVYLTLRETWATQLSQMSGIGDSNRILVAVPSQAIVDGWGKEGDIRILEKIPAQPGYRVDYVPKFSVVLDDFIWTLTQARLKVTVFADPELATPERENLRRATLNLFAPPR